MRDGADGGSGATRLRSQNYVMRRRSRRLEPFNERFVSFARRATAAGVCAPRGRHRRLSDREKEKPPYGFPSGVSQFTSNQVPGSDLLSHRQSRNYHRRRAFSLPSSKRDRVVPTRYGRQANRLQGPSHGSALNYSNNLFLTICRSRVN